MKKVELQDYFTYEESVPFWITIVIYESKLNIADFPPNESEFRYSNILKVRITVTAAWAKEDATKMCIGMIEGEVDDPRNSYETFSLLEYLELFKKEQETQESVMKLIDRYLPDK